MYGLHWLIHVKFTTSAGIALGYVIGHIPHSVGASPWLISFCAQKLLSQIAQSCDASLKMEITDRMIQYVHRSDSYRAYAAA